MEAAAAYQSEHADQQLASANDYMYLNAIGPSSPLQPGVAGQLLGPSVFHSEGEHDLPAFSTPTGPQLADMDPALQQVPNGQPDHHLTGADGLGLPRPDIGHKQKGKRQKLSQYRGVSKNKDKWVAQIGRDKRLCYLGLFETEEEAARAFDVAALRLRGDQAETNFPATDYAEELQSLSEASAASGLPVRRRRNKASQYRGVCLASGKYIAQITVDGKHHYLGVYPTEEDAARAYDRKAIELRGNSANLNFNVEDYADGGAAAGGGEAATAAIPQAIGQRGSSSRYRGVTGSQGKWIAQLVASKKYHYLGTFQEEDAAAQAYDKAALVLIGPHAQTNFPSSDYSREMAEATAMAANGEDPAAVVTLGRKRPKTSQFRGVCKSKDKWIAQIKCGPNHLYLGCFDTEEGAARAYDRQAISHRGARASTNFPQADYANDPQMQQMAGQGAAGDHAQQAGGVQPDSAQLPVPIMSDTAQQAQPTADPGAAAGAVHAAPSHGDIVDNSHAHFHHALAHPLQPVPGEQLPHPHHHPQEGQDDSQAHMHYMYQQDAQFVDALPQPHSHAPAGATSHPFTDAMVQEQHQQAQGDHQLQYPDALQGQQAVEQHHGHAVPDGVESFLDQNMAGHF